MKIGYVSRISIHLNKVVVLLNIKSSRIEIPCNSLFEANQIGLFNDIVINITPLEHITYHSYTCTALSSFIYPNSYIHGYKGINYDDLIRATTRISQRFDDPRFFNLLYLLIQNTVNVSDELLNIFYSSSNFSYLLFEFLPLIFFKYLS